MTPKKLFYILMGIIVVIVVGGGVGYVFASQMVGDKTLAVQKQLAQESVSGDRLLKLAELKNQYEKISPLIARFNDALPKSKNQSEIALQLQQLAQANNMTLPSINFIVSDKPSETSQTIKAGGVLALPITFQLNGTYEQLQGFLKGLEQLNRYTVVTNLSITRGEVASKTLSFNLGVNVFVKP